MTPMNKQKKAKIFGCNKLKLNDKNNKNEHIIIALYDRKKARRIFILSIITPKRGPLISVGAKVRKAVKPTKPGELVSSHASHPKTTL